MPLLPDTQRDLNLLKKNLKKAKNEMEPNLQKNKGKPVENVELEADLILKLTYIDFCNGLIEGYFG